MIKKECFFITPIGEPGTYEQNRMNFVIKNILKPVLKTYNYNVSIASRPNGSIPQNLITEILKADLVISDLSGGNSNVFYEMGYAHTIRKPTILIIEQTDPDIKPEFPFHMKNMYVGCYFFSDDKENIKQSRKRIRTVLKKIINNPSKINNNISEVISDIDTLKILIDQINIINKPQMALEVLQYVIRNKFNKDLSILCEDNGIGDNLKPYEEKVYSSINALSKCIHGTERFIMEYRFVNYCMKCIDMLRRANHEKGDSKLSCRCRNIKIMTNIR